MEDIPCSSKDADQVTQHVNTVKRWTKDLKLLPPFTHELLQRHVGAGTSDHDNNAHRHKKLGYRLFKDRYVNNVEVKPNVKMGNDEKFLIKAIVHASMKQKNYVVYVHLNQTTGEVVDGHCLCKAGKGGCCKHVAALLFQVIDYIELELSEVPDDLTCTQLLQQWHVPRTDELDEPVLYEDITFEKASYEKDASGRKHSTEKRQMTDYNPIPHFARQTSQSKIKEFANELEQEGRAEYLQQVLTSNDCQPFPFEEVNNSLPSKKRSTQFKQNTVEINTSNVRDQVLGCLGKYAINLSYVDIENIDFVKDLCTTEEHLLEIERNTRGQSACGRWYDERRRRITASNFGAILKRRKSIYPKSILNTLLDNKASKMKCPAPCKWGKDNEAEAVKQYLTVKQNSECHVNVCSSCGLIVNCSFPWLGASPDFLIHDMQEQASPLGLGEVKCPFSKKDNTIAEACEDPNFFLGILNGKVSLKRKHAYYYQIQGSMATLHLQWADFVVYTKKDLHVERVYFDNDLWEKIMVPELTSFYFEYVLPKIKE